jgi:uncharacterized protein
MQQIKISKSLLYILLIVATVSACTTNSNKAQTKSQSEKLLFKDSFPRAAGYVNDFAAVYSQTEKDSLENMIGHFEDSTSIQIAIITFRSSMVPIDSLEALTKAIGNAWGVGQKETNNGVVIGICPEYRRMTIRNGLGIEKIMSNEETKEIIDTYFTPGFKESKYFEGTVTGLQALVQILTKKLKAQ